MSENEPCLRHYFLRKLSVASLREYEGAVYHVMSRGNRQEPIFLADRDHEVFLDTLGEACDRCGWR